MKKSAILLHYEKIELFHVELLYILARKNISLISCGNIDADDGHGRVVMPFQNQFAFLMFNSAKVMVMLLFPSFLAASVSN